MSSDSDSSKQKQKRLKRQRSKQQLKSQVSVNQSPSNKIDDPTGLYDENRKLRRKLKELSNRLDEQLERAAENKLKQNSQKNNGHIVSTESQNLQLQNAYKMIERLQKAVRDYESKQAYHVTLKRVLDLESIIKKKQAQSQELKVEIKTLKKIVKDKEKHIEDLIESSKKMSNPTQDKEIMGRMKAKMKKLAQENDLLRKKELKKHEKLVQVERKLVEIQQNENQLPIGREESLLKQIDQYKNKYKECMQRIDKQNHYISKLNERLAKGETASKGRSEGGRDRKNISKSVEELPELKKKIQANDLLEHLPSPKIGIKLKRY